MLIERDEAWKQMSEESREAYVCQAALRYSRAKDREAKARTAEPAKLTVSSMFRVFSPRTAAVARLSRLGRWTRTGAAAARRLERLFEKRILPGLHRLHVLRFLRSRRAA
jgi:hypothetical protein